MLELPTLFDELRSGFSTETGRITATIIVSMFLIVAGNTWKWRMENSAPGLTAEARRQRYVIGKNIIWVVGFFIVATIWATKIAGFAFSIAAFAGALLIVSKEFLMCGIGYGVITVSRPYRIGDYIEIGVNYGRVVDITAFSTTLSEVSSSHDLTGRMITVPNNQLLTQPLKNHSATGIYVVNTIQLVLPFSTDVVVAEEVALEAVEKATFPWEKQVRKHLALVGERSFIELPSLAPSAAWTSKDGKVLTLSLRYSCPVEQRAATEQQIFREFWVNYQKKAIWRS